MVENEDILEFITGFPCTFFHCNGTLIEGEHCGTSVAVCSVYEHVYYAVNKH